MSSREGVEIDFCPQCRGVWLDRGELDKIIDRAATAFGGGVPAPAAAPDPTPRDDWSSPQSVDERDDERYEDRRKRKKRSFLDDLFDFD